MVMCNSIYCPWRLAVFALMFAGCIHNYVRGEEVPFNVSLDRKFYPYEGESVVPNITVDYCGEVLKEGIDYVLKIVGNGGIGTAEVTVSGVGSYSGTVKVPFYIVCGALCELDIESGVRVVTGSQIIRYSNLWSGSADSTIRVEIDGVTKVESQEPGEWEWSPGSVGYFTFKHKTITTGALQDEMSMQFYVPSSMQDATVKLSYTECLYDGNLACPSVTVTQGGKTMIEGLDYTVKYQGNDKPGVGVVLVRGVWGDTYERTFTIRPAGVCFLDIESGTRKAKETELLAYDETWVGNTNGTTRMRIMVNDAGEVNNLTGVGDYAWTPKKSGQYVVKLRTYVDDYLLSDKIETAYFEFEERIPLQITSVMATPRYPWNGKVDVDFTFTGDDRDYAVTLIARDGVGGTNLVVKTVGLEGPRSATADTGDQLILRPGTHRLTWDADADIADDAVFDRVSVSVRVEEK